MNLKSLFLEMRMSLKRWLDNGWLRRHQTSSKEISDLMEIVDRDLKDAKTGISDDWRFGIAYNAALKLCTIFIIRRRLQSGKKPSALSHNTCPTINIGSGPKERCRLS